MFCTVLQSLSQLEPNIHSSTWEWHYDVNYKNVLSIESLLPIPSQPWCTKSNIFRGQNLRLPVWELKENQVYQSISISMKIGEFLTINNTQTINKKSIDTVYFSQITLEDIKDHSFNIRTLYNVMNDLQMFNEYFGPRSDFVHYFPHFLFLKTFTFLTEAEDNLNEG